MSNMFKGLVAAGIVAVGAAFVTPVTAYAAGDRLECTVSVAYSLNNVDRMTYDQTFQIDPATPFSDDQSTILRFKWFDASMTRVNGVAQVTMSFFADVSTFNAVDLTATLKVKDESHGETTEGNSTFFSGIGVVGTHNTRHSLTCASAK